jgi:dTDP-4-dehydrorhamnose 3,5-epimerase
MEGIEITPLKIIEGENGDVLHGLRNIENSFKVFGEAYFSTVDFKAVKGWKKHTKMVSNLIVPVGEVRFVFFDERKGSATKGEFFVINLSRDNYCRLTVQPGLWMAFQGIGKEVNLLLNIASIVHDPNESVTAKIDTFNFEF